MGLLCRAGASTQFLVALLSPLLLAMIPLILILILILWIVEKWIFSFSSWVPLVVAAWATLQVLYKTLNPKWNQTFEFPDNGSPLELHVKDHNALLTTSNVGNCVVDYQRLPPNEMSDKWIPLQGVKKGEIHIQITRKVPSLQKKSSEDLVTSVTKARHISSQMKQMILELESMIDEGNSETLMTQLTELESLQDMQEECISQLETEQVLLLDKIKELDQEFFNSSPSPPLPQPRTLSKRHSAF